MRRGGKRSRSDSQLFCLPCGQEIGHAVKASALAEVELLLYVKGWIPEEQGEDARECDTGRAVARFQE